MSKIEELEKKIQEILVEIEELKSEVKEDRSIIKFKENESFFALTERFWITSWLLDGDPSSSVLPKVYNAFKTEEAAREARQRVLATLFFSQFASVHETEGWKPDWKNEKQLKYGLCFEHTLEKWIISEYDLQSLEKSYMSKECAEKCVDYCNKYFPDGVIKELD